ncbi:MAG: hypothetical protein GWN58_25735 [Anaerolineae bacterium]|nr:hypothetical protein [Anaerolineae bacterium]
MGIRYVILDLRDIQAQLGAHWDPAMRDEYAGVCEVCGEEVSQRANECPICGIPVVWRRSREWKRLYGSPQACIRLLSVVEPEDPAGAELCRLAGVPGFANQTEADRWRRAAKKLGQNRAAGIARHAVDRRGRGRGAVAYAINLAAKIAREKPKPRPKTPPAPTGEGGEFMI